MLAASESFVIYRPPPRRHDTGRGASEQWAPRFAAGVLQSHTPSIDVPEANPGARQARGLWRQGTRAERCDINLQAERRAEASFAQGAISMRAAIMRGNRIVVDEFADPVPRTGELLVRTRACGICGSDVHMLERHGDNSPSPAGFDVRGDVVMGHEFCCEVVDYGPQTSRRIKAGQLVCSVPI